jgi:hypothetical protein
MKQLACSHARWVALSLVALLVGACGQVAQTSDATETSYADQATSPNADIVEELVLEVGGSFADQPSAPGGYMTPEQAIQEAILRGAVPGQDAMSTPRTELRVVTYEEYRETIIGTVESQLPPENSVYLVHVMAPFPGEALPRPAGFSQPADWRSYYVAYDPRTALALSVTPGD